MATLPPPPQRHYCFFSIHCTPNAMSVACLVLHLDFWFSSCYVCTQVPSWDDNWTRLVPAVCLPSWYQIHAIFNIENWPSDSPVSTGCPSVQFNLSQQFHTNHSKLSSPTGLGLGHIPTKASHSRLQTQVEFPDYWHFCLLDQKKGRGGFPQHCLDVWELTKICRTLKSSPLLPGVLFSKMKGLKIN